MLTKLIVASILALNVVPSIAVARSPMKPYVKTTVFEIDRRLKADVDLPEIHFEIRSDGSWSYIRTRKQAIETQGTGTLKPGQLTRIRAALARASWTVTTDMIACMAFAATYTQYSVNGAPMWKDEMCSNEHLDQRSAKQLAEVMTIVTPIMAGMVK